MNRYGTALLLLAGVLVAAPLRLVDGVPTAQAAEVPQWHHRDDCDGHHGRRGRDRDCRDNDRGAGRWRHEGDRDGWRRIRHDDHGDCFRTPWGLACETGREGVFRVRDRHRGDERGPDCDILIIEEWGWRCYDSPHR